MKTWQSYKKLVITFWEALNDKNLSSSEKERDAIAFNRFFDKCMNVIYFFFTLFSLISLYFFTTRVIF